MPKQTDTPAKELTATDLDAIPTPATEADAPGTIVGTGVAAERAPYKKEWFLDVAARRKDLSPEYDLHPVMSAETIDISVNGVAFRLLAGRLCKLPSPHYQVYLDRLKSQRELDEKYAPPAGGPEPMKVYRQQGVWQKTPIE